MVEEEKKRQIVFSAMGDNIKKDENGLTHPRWKHILSAILVLFIAEGIPALCLKFKFIVVACDKHAAETFFRDVTDLPDSLYFLYFFIVADGYGEEQFVVFSAIERAGREVHIELFGGDGRLIIDGDFFFINTAAAVALLADMHQFAAQPV